MAEGITGKIKPLGDLKRPVRVGEAFAKVASGVRDQDLTPRKIRNPNWTMGNDQTMVSKVLGRVMVKDDGVLVRPVWTLAKDRTLLTVAVYPTDYKGRPISVEDIAEAVSEGAGYPPLDADALEAAVARAAETGEAQPGCVLAKGLPPTHGRDAKLKLAFRHGKGTGTMRSDGSMDFRERGVLEHLAAGDRLAVLYPATQGTPGEDVFGKPVAAVDGRPLNIKAGDGVEAVQGQEGAIEFKATVEGLPEFEHGTLRISSTLEVPGDVDMESGNVRSSQGSVSVRGAVCTGFTVEAGKDVTVNGMVEDAVIKAGGDVNLAGGVHMAEAGHVQAGGAVTAKFMEHARIKAVGDVSSTMDIIQCDITSGGAVQANAGQGNVVGGVIRCRGGLTAKEVGSENALATVVEIIVRGPKGLELEERAEGLQARLEKLERGLGVENALDALLQAPEEDRRILAQLIKVKSDIQTELKTVDKELETDMAQAQGELAGTAVKVTGTVHPGVTIRIANRVHKVTETMGPTVFRWNARNREIETA